MNVQDTKNKTQKSCSCHLVLNIIIAGVHACIELIIWMKHATSEHQMIHTPWILTLLSSLRYWCIGRMYTDSNRGMSVSTNGHLGKRWLFHGPSHGWWKYYCLLLLIPNVKYIFHSSVFPQAHTNNNSTDTNFHLHKFIKMGRTWGSTSCMLRQMSWATCIIPLVWHDPPPHHPHTQKKKVQWSQILEFARSHSSDPLQIIYLAV